MAFSNGGLSFLLPYILFILFVALPLFIAEIMIGSSTQSTPDGAFFVLGGPSRWWRRMGLMTILTGFLISSFYSVVTGWIFNYCVESIFSPYAFSSHAESVLHWQERISHIFWPLIGHSAVAILCLYILAKGVQQGLERLNKICMPIFFVTISALLLWATSLSGFSRAINYITTLQPTSASYGTIILAALGHAFFTLSVGQGTLVTYGSYTTSSAKLFSSSLIVAFVDSLISIIATILLLTTLFSHGDSFGTLSSGPSLLFETLPTFFLKMGPPGQLFCPLFFFLIFIAALTSQLSALEPAIKMLETRRGYMRKKAACLVIFSSWALGIFSALSLGSINILSWGSLSWFDVMNFITTSIMVPLGALFAAILFIRTWKMQQGTETFAHLPKAVQHYLIWSLRLSPISICLVFISALFG